MACGTGASMRASGFRHSWIQGMGSLLLSNSSEGYHWPASVDPHHSRGMEFSDWLDLSHMSNHVARSGGEPQLKEGS